MSEVLEVAVREDHGKLRNRRLRANGIVPAVLYGHGEESVSLSIKSENFRASLRHGAKVVQLSGAADCQALFKAVQWDTFHQHVLHVDLLRVDEKDRIKVQVPIAVRGDAPGTHEGGVIEHVVRTIEIETSPANIPEQLIASVNELHVGDAVKSSQLTGLPSGAIFVDGDDLMIVHCIEPSAAAPAEDDDPTTATAAEPEVIGQKKEDEED